MKRRWSVERTKDSFEGVRADTCELSSHGVLSFHDKYVTNPAAVTSYGAVPIEEYFLVMAYAPGTWLTVFEDPDE